MKKFTAELGQAPITAPRPATARRRPESRRGNSRCARTRRSRTGAAPCPSAGRNPPPCRAGCRPVGIGQVDGAAAVDAQGGRKGQRHDAGLAAPRRLAGEVHQLRQFGFAIARGEQFLDLFVALLARLPDGALLGLHLAALEIADHRLEHRRIDAALGKLGLGRRGGLGGSSPGALQFLEFDPRFLPRDVEGFGRHRLCGRVLRRREKAQQVRARDDADDRALAQHEKALDPVRAHHVGGFGHGRVLVDAQRGPRHDLADIFRLALQRVEIGPGHVLAAGQDLHPGFALPGARRRIGEAEIALADHAERTAFLVDHGKAADSQPQHGLGRRPRAVVRPDRDNRRRHDVAHAGF